MISNLSRDELLVIGARHRANYMVAQGRYAVGLAAEDPEVAGLAGPEFMAEMGLTVGKLEMAARDRDLAATEAKEKTVAQGDAVQAAKVARRALVHRVLAAMLRGVKLPADLGRIMAYGSNPQAIGRDLQRLVELARPHLAELEPLGITTALLDRCAALAGACGQTDQAQEVARLKKLPEKVQEMYVQKALVYVGIKQLNYLGRSVHAEEAGQRARYNLDILYRRVRRQPVEGPTPIPTPAPPA
ncbi:MAG: hypothetical protein HY906_19310 [Deltaproteobacteria bacterium]|nr:hypothetical protein [Deltaproteobacteria bacterium]